MNKEFEKSVSCNVLKANYKKMGDRFDPSLEDATFLTIVNHSIEKADFLFAPSNIYESSINRLCRDYQIPIANRQIVLDTLERSAVFYMILYVNNFQKLLYEDWLKKLEDLGRSAKKLQMQIPKDDVDFYEKLSFFDHFEEGSDDDIAPVKFFQDVLNKLEIIRTLRENILGSNLGKVYGFNVPSRKKNHALNEWIKRIYDVWHQVLERDLARDKFEVSGRKRFLEFMQSCIIPLHPELVSDFSDPLGRLDTALKGVQKELKLREENAPEK